jgi:hypothetical protein
VVVRVLGRLVVASMTVAKPGSQSAGEGAGRLGARLQEERLAPRAGIGNRSRRLRRGR